MRRIVFLLVLVSSVAAAQRPRARDLGISPLIGGTPGKLDKIVFQIFADDTQEVPDPTLDLGKRVVDKTGREGAKVTVSRTIKQNGRVVATECLHSDTYSTSHPFLLSPSAFLDR